MAELYVGNIVLLFIAFVMAVASASWLHPHVVKVAKLKGITDNPDKRKLQREPVPVLGGTVVFFGAVMGIGIISLQYDCPDLMFTFALMLLMLYIGTLDDIFGLTPRIRLIIEILAALIIIYVGGYRIGNFYGLWGLYHIASWISVPLTILTVVGIINAINLIDGVNGLSSGYCIMACAIFCGYFYLSGDMVMAGLAAACIGALIPFFIHNVFGRESRMFIGDGGTLMMGIVLSLFVLRILNEESAVFDPNFGLIPFTLATLAIPVFDTLRVMTTRIIKGISPFHPDKTHLHHAFIGFGFSHLGTTLSILALNLLILGGWLLLWLSGATINTQLYLVVGLTILILAGVIKRHKTQNTGI